MAHVKARNCCVSSCTNTHETCSSFFRFPNDSRDRKRWKSAIGLPPEFEVKLENLQKYLLYLNEKIDFSSQLPVPLSAFAILWNEISHKNPIEKQDKKHDLKFYQHPDFFWIPSKRKRKRMNLNRMIHFRKR